MKIYWTRPGWATRVIWTSLRSAFLLCLLSHGHELQHMYRWVLERFFPFFRLIARSFMWISKHLLPSSFAELFRPNDLSVRIVQYFPFLSFFLLSLVGSKWDCGANTLHDLRNDTFLAEMDIKGASRSGSIAPHLLDLFNEDGCSHRPIQCSFGISHRNTFSLFQFRN